MVRPALIEQRGQDTKDPKERVSFLNVGTQFINDVQHQLESKQSHWFGRSWHDHTVSHVERHARRMTTRRCRVDENDIAGTGLAIAKPQAGAQAKIACRGGHSDHLSQVASVVQIDHLNPETPRQQPSQGEGRGCFSDPALVMRDGDHQRTSRTRFAFK